MSQTAAEKKKNKSTWLVRLAALGILLAGVGILLYPLISNYLYEQNQQQLAAYYENLAGQLPEEEKSEELEAVQDYNADLVSGGVLLTDPFDANQLDPSVQPYADLLNLQGDGAMGTLEIPAIGLNLVIYHGTTEEVLQKGVGHLQGTSLPVGGIGTHAVLSAHTGLPDKELFTDLDQMVIGDVFYIHVLGETLAYQVDQILVVEPSNTQDLKINAGEDYVTLVTCTPYGINSHRLLVRGTRIPYEEAQAIQQQTMDRPVTTWQQQYLTAVAVGLAILAAVILLVMLLRRRRKKKRKQNL